jgi:hypothetical protein
MTNLKEAGKQLKDVIWVIAGDILSLL